MARFKGPTENFVSTTLNGSINDSVDSIILNDASKLQYPGYIIIDREDGNGTSTPSAREVVSYTGITSNTLTGCTRGADSSTAGSHSDGALVEATLTAGMWDDLIDNTVDLTTAQTLTTKTLTTPVIASFYQDAGKTKLMTTPNTASDTLVTLAASQTLTNKTLTSPKINEDVALTASATELNLLSGITSLSTAKNVVIQVVDGAVSTSVGDGKAYFTIPEELNGMNLVNVHAAVITAGTTNTTDIQIRNVTDTADMLSTKMTIDTGETSTATAAAAAVIDATKDDVATNDLIAIDVDAVSTTAAKGLIVRLRFELP